MATEKPTIDVDGIPYPYRLRRSKRARHLLLHVDPQEGIEVVVPWRIPLYAAEQFLRDKQEWVAQTVRKYTADRPWQAPRSLVTGTVLPYLGQSLELLVIQRTGRPRIRVIEPATLQVMAEPEADLRYVICKWYRQQARHYFADACTQLAEKIQVRYTALSVRDMKTRWGSCTGSRLSFNWRLLLAPAEVAQYVAVHEVVHLQHPNHSPAFWAQVEQLQPDAQIHRKWLRKNGYRLVL